MMLRVCLVVVLCAPFAAHHVRASELIGEWTTIDCYLKPGRVLTVEGSKIEDQKDTSKPFTITFTAFNPQKTTAKLVGNAGAVDVFYDVVDRELTIVQLFGSAIRTLTSMVIPAPGETTLAVQSRHVQIDNLGIYSQWSGQCRLR